MLRLETLPSRDCPAVSLGGGLLMLDSGVTVHVFPDWTGTYNTLTSGDLTYVGGTGGAGPRVAVLNQDGSRAQPDYFAGPEGDRFGLVFVDTSPDPRPAFEAVSIGTGYTLFVDADRNLDLDTAAVVREAARYLAPVLDTFRVTNVRPDLTPGSYWSFVVDGSGGTWQGPSVVGRATVGSIPSANPGFSFKLGIGRGAVGIETPPRFLAAVMAHEFGHGAGLQHDRTPGSIMSTPLDTDGAFLPEHLPTLRAAGRLGMETVRRSL